MRRAFLGAALCVLVACGGGGGDECDLSVVHGSYLVSLDTIDGTCGPQAGGLTTLATLQPVMVQGCVSASVDIDDQACRGDSVFNCVFPASNASIGYQVIMNMDDKRGDVITGVQSMTVYYLNTGTFWCQGTYKVTFTRQ